jgi:hypothetical protein
VKCLLRNVLIFLLGFAFGVATFTTFHHEIELNSQIRTLVTLLITGVFLTGTILAWLNRLRIRSENTNQKITETPEWAYFMWGSVSLLIIYLALVLIFVEF